MLTGLAASIAAAIRFAPLVSVLLVGLGGTFTAGAAVWKLKDFWFTTFAEPQIRRDERSIVTAEFEALAEKAKRDRELELFKLFDKWSTETYLAGIEDEAWDEAQRKLLQDKIDDYENGADGESGGGGVLTDLDVRFLDGLLAQSGAAPRGRGQGQGAIRGANPAANGAQGLH